MAHWQTQECVRKAEILIQEGSTDSLRYASIQLRMGIEYVFYRLLSVYRDELSDDITKIWQPQKIMDAILACDPHADQDATLSIGPAGAFKNPNATEGVIVKHSKAPTKKLLKDNYHRLGFYLHAPVDLKEPNNSKWVTDLNNVVISLKEFDTTKVVMNLRKTLTIKCEACGRDIIANIEGVKVSKEMQCKHSDCKAIHDAEIDGEKLWSRLRTERFVCPYCGRDNEFSVASLVDGAYFPCGECKKRVMARSCFQLVPADGDPPDSPGENS